MLAIIIFILILSILVMIHEFGHFLMAKRAGIGVEEFGFGLPPRAWGKKIGETIYSVNWLPFGGFVRLVGEDPTDKNRNAQNSFYVKTLSQRTKVVIAGVVANFILAVIIFYIVLFALGFKVSLPLFVDHKFKFVNQAKQVLVADVSQESVAQKAGIKAGDSIIKIEDSQISSIDQLQGIVRSSGGRELVITLENPMNNQTRIVMATPVYNKELKAPVLGVSLGELVVLRYETFGQKLFAGFAHSYNTLDYSVRVFGKLIGFAIRERDIAPVSEGVSGPIGIAQITVQAVSMGAISVLQLVGLLSLNLAFINILPIPALDGGRFLFIVIEAVTRRKVYPKVEKWVHTVGFALLIGLIILVTYNDILKLLR
jgi:regulator of sigma E protease